MATSLLYHLPAPPSPAIDTFQPRQANIGLPNSFLHGTKVISTSPPRLAAQRSFKSLSVMASYSNNVPKQFREENLPDGLMDNYKNVPQSLYGLNPSQLNMFMTEDNPASRLSETTKEESISAAYSYEKYGGMYSLSNTGPDTPSPFLMSMNGTGGASMYGGGPRGRGYGRRSAPPDLPSLLLDGRIVYLGMPIVPQVTELIFAQFMWLDYEDQEKPIYLYINSPGTQNEDGESVASELEAYAIADAMAECKAPIYTVNVGMAYGQAAMLLSLGKKGKRAGQPHSAIKLYMPEVHRSGGTANDMWHKARNADIENLYFMRLLARGIGKPMKEIARDIRAGKFFLPEKAIEYGIIDRIISPNDKAFERKNYNELLAQRRALRGAGGGGAGAQAAPSGMR